MTTLSGQSVAVVTGAASGIGRSMAEAFGRAGMRVVLSDVRDGALDAAVSSLREAGHDVIGHRADVSLLTDVESLAVTTLDHYGRVDIVCNNAGVARLKPIARLSIEDWAWTLGIDLWGVIHGVHVFLPIMENQGFGHISATSSVGGLQANRGGGPYNVAKAGVISLMSTLERELRAAGSPVRASVLCPGPVNTSLATSSVEVAGTRGDTGRDGSDDADDVASRMDSALKAHGADPQEVGNLVLDAVREQRFWILTHPEAIAHLHGDLEAMVRDGSLPTIGVERSAIGTRMADSGPS